MHQDIIVVKTYQLLQVQIMSGSRLSLGGHILTPYPESQGEGLFGQKHNHRTLKPRESVNATTPTVNTLTVRGSHKTSFHAYNIIPMKTLHTNQQHLPIY